MNTVRPAKSIRRARRSMRLPAIQAVTPMLSHSRLRRVTIMLAPPVVTHGCPQYSCLGLSLPGNSACNLLSLAAWLQ